MNPFSIPIFKYLLVVVLAFFAPIQSLIFAVIGLVFIDTLTGLYKAYKTGVPITSKVFGHVVSKLLLYNLSIIAGHYLEGMINIQAVHIAQIVAVAIGMTELKSILENCNAITGVDLWKFVMVYIKRNTDSVSKTIEENNEQKDF